MQCGTAQEILVAPANDYVADFIQHMNPLGVLTAADVMSAGPGDRAKPVATAKPTTAISDIIRVLAQAGGTIAVVDQGRIKGTVSADDIVAAVARYQNRKAAS